MGDLVLVLDLVIMYYILVILASLAYCQAQMIDPKAGQTLSPSFTCGKYTTRTVLYKLTSCKEMRMTCQKFYVDNRDPLQVQERYPKKGFSCTTVCSKPL